MAHVQDSAVVSVEQAHQVLLQHALQVRVERAERLVQHEDARPRRQHAGERHALLLAAGELRRVALVEALQAEALELRGHDGIAHAARHGALDARAHVLGHGEVREQHVALEQKRRLTLLRREVVPLRGIEEHLVVNHDAPLVGRLDAGDAAHGEALAAPRRTEEPQRLVPRRERHVQRERGVLLLDVDFQAHASALLRYFVVRRPQRLMNRMTTKLNSMMTIVQKMATSVLPFIHSK